MCQTRKNWRRKKANATRTGPIAGPPFGQNLNSTQSETEHAELLLADPVGRVGRLRLAEIGDRLGAAVQRFIGEAAVVVGLYIGRIELDRLRARTKEPPGGSVAGIAPNARVLCRDITM